MSKKSTKRQNQALADLLKQLERQRNVLKGTLSEEDTAHAKAEIVTLEAYIPRRKHIKKKKKRIDLRFLR